VHVHIVEWHGQLGVLVRSLQATHLPLVHRSIVVWNRYRGINRACVMLFVLYDLMVVLGAIQVAVV
jgi:hypothetical protein